MLTTQLEGCVAKGRKDNQTTVRHHLTARGAPEPGPVTQNNQTPTTKPNQPPRVDQPRPRPHLTSTTRSGMPLCAAERFRHERTPRER